jgi:hypothetical protein
MSIDHVIKIHATFTLLSGQSVIEWYCTPRLRQYFHNTWGDHQALKRYIAKLLGNHLGIRLYIDERLAPPLGIPEFEPGICPNDHDFGLEVRILTQKWGDQDAPLPVRYDVRCS